MMPKSRATSSAARNVDDGPVSPRRHVGQSQAAEHERPVHVDGENLVPGVDRIVPQLVVRAGDTRIVDQNVDRGRDLQRILDGLGDGGLVR